MQIFYTALSVLSGAFFFTTTLAIGLTDPYGIELAQGLSLTAFWATMMSYATSRIETKGKTQ